MLQLGELRSSAGCIHDALTHYSTRAAFSGIRRVCEIHRKKLTESGNSYIMYNKHLQSKLQVKTALNFFQIINLLNLKKIV